MQGYAFQPIVDMVGTQRTIIIQVKRIVAQSFILFALSLFHYCDQECIYLCVPEKKKRRLVSTKRMKLAQK